MANLPQDIVLNIVVRLPVKSILRFRCVSKAWCKLLKDPKFVRKHLNLAIEMNRFSVMMSFTIPFRDEDETGTYTTDYDPSLSTLSDCVRINYPSAYKDSGIQFWGTCNGLICGSPGGENCAVLWNPATKEFKEVPTVPIEPAIEFSYCKYALGYDDEIDNFKVACFVGFLDAFCEVYVYTLKSNSWRRLANIPYELCAGQNMAHVSVNGATHWLRLTDSEPYRVIASFDFKDESFDKMHLPSFCDKYVEPQLCSLRGSLCFLGSTSNSTDVWEMKGYGVTESWAELFTIDQEDDTFFQFCRRLVPLQFAKDDEILLKYNTNVGYHLDLYDIKDGTSENLKDYFQWSWYHATTFAYVESLVTLNSGTYVGLQEIEDS